MPTSPSASSHSFNRSRASSSHFFSSAIVVGSTLRIIVCLWVPGSPAFSHFHTSPVNVISPSPPLNLTGTRHWRHDIFRFPLHKMICVDRTGTADAEFASHEREEVVNDALPNLLV